MTREAIFEYVKSKYNVEPDYPFPNAPGFPVIFSTISCGFGVGMGCGVGCGVGAGGIPRRTGEKDIPYVLISWCGDMPWASNEKEK